MNKTLILVLTIVSSVFVSGVSYGEGLEERVAKLEAQMAALMKTSSEGGVKELAVIPETSVAPLKLNNWSYSVGQGQFGEHYTIKTDLENVFTKDIKLIDASIHFKDLLGESLYAIRVDKDLKITAKGFSKDSGSYDINQYIAAQNRMKSMKQEDIIATLVVRQVVFSDNTVWKSSE